MNLFEAKSKWLLIAVFYALINDSLNCTFRSVTDNFSASLKGIYNVTTEQECLSKCSVDPECTFLTYYEGRCEVFEDGDDVQDLASVSKAFSYSFEEHETSCPTTIVSKPQNSSRPSTAPNSIMHCKSYHKLMFYGTFILTKKNLLETPGSPRGCNPGNVPENCNCTFKKVDESNGRLTVTDYVLNQPWTWTVCGDYNGVDAPNAIAEYICTETGQYVYVVDNETGANPQFPDFVGLERIKTSPIFYVGEVYCKSP
ncbi:unnamed protein product [Cylicocyclus nassatus]|uniref:Apple domain-containing protein n=1 Tax=Cylicocyclus nassatus TaxID=53992 RepID=A0AA36M969_CYLNA|nr:unnamed protein product [Cylicocyclus nassatus]